MMSEEEKEAIEECEKLISILDKTDETGKSHNADCLRKLLKINKKLQKQIKCLDKLHYDLGANYIDLDKKYKQLQKETEELQKDKKALIKNYDKVLGTFICKDKIREIIAEYQKQLESADTERTAIMLSNFIMVLNDLLLEEN